MYNSNGKQVVEHKLLATSHFSSQKNELNETFPTDDGEEWLNYVKKRRIDVDADSDGGK